MKNKMKYSLAVIGVLTINILLATTVKAMNDSVYGSMHQGMMNMMNGHMHSMMHTDVDTMHDMHEGCEEMMGGEMHEECEEMMESGRCPMMGNH